MDPSEEKKRDNTPPKKKKSKLRVVALIILLLIAIAGGAFYFYLSSDNSSSPTADSTPDEITVTEAPAIAKDATEEVPTDSHSDVLINKDLEDSLTKIDPIPEITQEDSITEIVTEEDTPEPVTPALPVPSAEPVKTPEPKPIKKVSICDKPTLQLDDFYKHLDSQAYMADFKIGDSSEKHFTALIHKLLANPPQVTRESDDLYTILKNTAHFFRISGKDNIFMLQGILNNEKSSVEQILADYYQLITTTECDQNTYAKNIDHDALYEYACFFLNTMGGRLYLFRRDSLSRMVVTYYAILLVERANIQNNNRHGIALRPVVNMLISEMESGGSALKHSDAYLDSLYDLKEKYQ